MYYIFIKCTLIKHNFRGLHVCFVLMYLDYSAQVSAQITSDGHMLIFDELLYFLQFCRHDFPSLRCLFSLAADDYLARRNNFRIAGARARESSHSKLPVRPCGICKFLLHTLRGELSRASGYTRARITGRSNNSLPPPFQFRSRSINSPPRCALRTRTSHV